MESRIQRTLLSFFFASFFFIFYFLMYLPNDVEAQGEVEPQRVTATLYDSDCFPNGVENRIEFFNVGSQGGEAYSKAVYVYAITHIGNHPDGGLACFVDGYAELIGTFSGGPNGTITFPKGNYQEITTCQVIDGKTIECLFVMDLPNFGIQEMTSVYTIQNPEAFTSPPATPTTGTGCTPSVRGLNPAKPGDTISPGASYADAAGKETSVIQDRWFFNGQESTSIVWDGKPVTVELQWTCLDHSGHSKTFTIPAYQGEAAAPLTQPQTGQPAETSQEAQPKRPKTVAPWGIAAIISSIVGLVGAASVGIGYALKKKPAAPAPPAPPAQSPPPNIPVQYPPIPDPAGFSKIGAPTRYTPPATAGRQFTADVPVQNTPPQVEPSSHQPAGMTPAQREELLSIRGQMQIEAANLKNKYYDNKEKIDRLKGILKNNMLKFITKKGFDVQEWMLEGPTDVVNKIIVDPIMEKAFQKHDTSQDGKIIVDMYNRIKQMENEMHELSKEFEYLQNEMNKIDQKLK